jgi:hypothetical protein
MSGGGSSKKKSSSSKKAEPAIPGTGPMMTQPAFMPGNDNLLAQQLAAGGYGSVPDLLSMFQQTFTPLQVLNTQPGAAPTPTTPQPSSSGGSSGGSGGSGRLVFRVDGKTYTMRDVRGGGV